MIGQAVKVTKKSRKGTDSRSPALASAAPPRRAAVADTLRDAVDLGELPSDVDIEVAVDALVSPPYYRLMFGMPPLDGAAVDRLVQTVWQGYA